MKRLHKAGQRLLSGFLSVVMVLSYLLAGIQLPVSASTTWDDWQLTDTAGTTTEAVSEGVVKNSMYLKYNAVPSGQYVASATFVAPTEGLNIGLGTPMYVVYDMDATYYYALKYRFTNDPSRLYNTDLVKIAIADGTETSQTANTDYTQTNTNLTLAPNGQGSSGFTTDKTNQTVNVSYTGTNTVTITVTKDNVDAIINITALRDGVDFTAANTNNLRIMHKAQNSNYNSISLTFESASVTCQEAAADPWANWQAGDQKVTGGVVANGALLHYTGTETGKYLESASLTLPTYGVNNSNLFVYVIFDKDDTNYYAFRYRFTNGGNNLYNTAVVTIPLAGGDATVLSSGYTATADGISINASGAGTSSPFTSETNGATTLSAHTVKVEYIAVDTAKITVTKNSASVSISIQRTDANFTATGTNNFGIIHNAHEGADSSKATMALTFTDPSVTWAAAAVSPADEFKTTYSEVLSLTVDTVQESDRTAIEAALAAYALLETSVQEELATQKALLDALVAALDLNKEVATFQTNHSTILGKSTDTVEESDRDAINATLSAYAALSEAAQNKLTAQKTLLDSLLVALNKKPWENWRLDGEEIVSGVIASGKYMTYNAVPSGQYLKEATFEIPTVGVNLNATSLVYVVYDVDATYYYALQYRFNNDSSKLYNTNLVKISIESGEVTSQTENTDFTQTNTNLILAPNGQANTTTPYTVETQTTATNHQLNVKYISKNQVTITITKNAVDSVITVTTLRDDADFTTANANNLRLMHKAQNASAQAMSLTFVSASAELGTPVDYTPVAEFRTTYATILSTSVADVTIADQETITDAINAYNAMSEELQAALSVEIAHLNALQARLDTIKGYQELAAGTGVYTQDFENGNDFASYAGYEEISDDSSVTVKSDFIKNGVLADADNNQNALYIVNKMTDSGWATNNVKKYGQFITADKALYDAMKTEGKYLSSGSFDLYLTGTVFNSNTITYMYQDNDNYQLYALSDYVGLMQARDYVIKGEKYDQLTIGGDIAHQIYNPRPQNTWFHFEFFYTADGTFELFGFDEDGKLVSYQHSAKESDYYTDEDRQVALENRILAFGQMSSGLGYYVDNVTLKFTANGVPVTGAAEVVAFLNDYEVMEAMDVNPATAVPYDAARIDILSNAYSALSDDAKALIPAVTERLAAQQTTLAKWDAGVAAGFTAVTEGLTDAQKLSIYNRLSVTDRATVTFTAPADTTGDSDGEIDISCVGDSLTYGQGATSHDTDTYPAQLQTLLGDSYAISNYGISGIRVLNSTNLTTDTSTAGQYRHTSEFLKSTYSADVVLIMMGTNDVGHIDFTNEDQYAQLKAAFTNLIHSYLALETNPTVVIATVPARGNNATGDGWSEQYAKLQREVATEYGIPVVDMYAATTVARDTLGVDTIFVSDGLHFTTAGYTQIAQAYADFIALGEAKALTDSATIIDFTKAEYAQYAPNVTGATMTTAADRIYFQAEANLTKTGATIVDYGMIFTYTQYVTEGHASYKLPMDAMTYNSDSEYLYQVTCGSSIAANTAYGAFTFSIDSSLYGVRVIARSYVVYDDGTVYYSCNSTDGGSISSATGVENGYASRSIISISTKIMKFLYQYKDAENTPDSIKGDTGVSKFLTDSGWTEYAMTEDTDNGKAKGYLIPEFLADNSDDVITVINNHLS